MPHSPAVLRRLSPVFALLVLCLAGVFMAAAPTAAVAGGRVGPRRRLG